MAIATGVFGVFLLYVGAEILVKSAKAIARFFKGSSLVIGLTIVAFCAAVPGAISTLLSQLKGASGDVALESVLHSNSTSIGLILGLFLLTRPSALSFAMKWQKMPLLLFIYLFVFLVMLGGTVKRVEGIYLFLILILYTFLQFFIPPKGAKSKRETPQREIFLPLLGVVATLFLFSFGSSLLIAVPFHMVLPLLAIALVCALRNEQELMIGTVIGSNIFNPLLILPAATLVKPIAFPPKMLSIDFPIMVGFSILLWGLMLLRKDQLSRIDGAILLLSYLAYIAYFAY